MSLVGVNKDFVILMLQRAFQKQFLTFMAEV